ncbi:xylulokinase [Treponema sp. R6D11]
MLLTADIGTSSLKSAIFDYDGNRLSFASFPLSVDANADCSQWIKAFKDCCLKLGNTAKVEAVVISGNGPSLVPVLGEPKIGSGGLEVPADKTRFWLDRSAVKYQEEVSAVMDGFVDACFFLPKILKIKNEEAQLYQKTKTFLGVPEYLAYALTGSACTVFPSEGFDRWFWDDSVLEKLDLDAAKFPPFISPGDAFGKITPLASEYFALPKNIPVITDGPDFFSAITGSGVVKPSHACDRTGSSGGINLCTKDRVLDKRLMSYGHPVKPYWNLSGTINTTGKAIEWCKNFMGLESFDDFFALARQSKAGSGGLVFVPYLAGERAPVWNPNARALWRGIGLSSGRAEFANSVLEGIAFAIRDVIGVMETNGVHVENLRVTGRLSGIDSINQIKADITGKQVLSPMQKETELLGLAITGSCFKGKYASLTEASSVMVKTDKTYDPNPKNADLYKELFLEYKK